MLESVACLADVAALAVGVDAAAEDVAPLAVLAVSAVVSAVIALAPVLVVVIVEVNNYCTVQYFARYAGPAEISLLVSCPPLLNLPVFLMTVAVVRVVMMTRRRRLERKEVKTVAQAAMLTTPWCSTALSRHKQLTAPGRCNVNTVNTDCNTQLPPQLETLF